MFGWTCVSRPPSIIQPLLVWPHMMIVSSPPTHPHTTPTPQLLSSESFLLFSRTLKCCYLLFQSCRPDLKLQLEVNQLHPLTTCTVCMSPREKSFHNFFRSQCIHDWLLVSRVRTGIYLRFWVQPWTAYGRSTLSLQGPTLIVHVATNHKMPEVRWYQIMESHEPKHNRHGIKIKETELKASSEWKR